MVYVSYPKVTIPTELGEVQAAFTDGDHVHISTNAHVNDDRPTIRYRNTDYLIGIHLYGTHDWEPKPDRDRTYQSIKRRDNWSHAAPTHHTAILKVITDAVRAYVKANPDVLRRAEYADANNSVDQAQKKVDELTQQLKEARAALRSEKSRMERNRTTESHSVGDGSP